MEFIKILLLVIGISLITAIVTSLPLIIFYLIPILWEELDPFGTYKRREKEDFDDLIERCNQRSKRVDEALARKDYTSAMKIIDGFKTE